MKFIPKTLGGRLREAREALGYSQEYVEEKTKVPQNTISRLELDVVKNPKREHIKTLAQFYGVTEEYIVTNPYSLDHIPWEIQLMLYDKEALPYITKVFNQYKEHRVEQQGAM